MFTLDKFLECKSIFYYNYKLMTTKEAQGHSCHYDINQYTSYVQVIFW